MINQRLVIISNRLPYQISIKKGKVHFSPSAGGLVSGINSCLQNKNHRDSPFKILPVWVGATDVTENEFTAHFPANLCDFNDFTLSPVFLPKDIWNKYYNGFCNDTIWPLFHYFPSYTKFIDEHYESYQLTNRYFADKIVSIYKPGDILWIHDYHLMLLPALLRERIPEATIGFFLHIPFPSFEIFRLLPKEWRKDILTGMVGADLVGFHTNDYVQYFLKSARQILGYENALRTVVMPDRSMTVDAFPISIDFNKFHYASDNEIVQAEMKIIKDNLNEVQTIVSIDRLDYTKAIVKRLESFEFFLQHNQSYHGKVTYILTVVPSRDIIASYKENKRKIDEMVSSINSTYGNIGWLPVLYQYKSLTFEQLAAMYLTADVALITPIRDGMNLVCKEFVASRNDKKGVLILSETAGAASELGEALIVNPTDKKEVAQALLRGLNMPLEEQRERLETMQKRLRNYDVVKWADDYLSTLASSKAKSETLRVIETNYEIESEILKKYKRAKNRILFLDYDGTLTPLVKLPQFATPSSQLIGLLEELGTDSGNTVVLISGRGKEVLEQWFGHLPVHLIAEHGAFIKKHSEDWTQITNINADWKKNVFPILEQFANRCPGAFVEEKQFSLVWHYRNSEIELARVRSQELLNSLDELSGQLDFQVVGGNKSIEARTRGIDKGIVVSSWLKKQKYDFVLAVGDDNTDEDMFKVTPKKGFTIRVGLVSTSARYNMKNAETVIRLLQKLTNSNPVNV